MNYPKFTKGTEKQIKWAEEIRRKRAPYFERQIERIQPQYQSPKMRGIATKVANQIKKMIMTTDATWWIENRNSDPASIIEGLAGKEMKKYKDTFSVKVKGYQRKGHYTQGHKVKSYTRRPPRLRKND